MDDNAGSLFQYLISTNYTGQNTFILYLRESSQGTAPNRWDAWLYDSNSTSTGAIRSSSSPGADSTWRLIIVQRATADNEIQLWFCEKDGAASKEASTSDAGFDDVNVSNIEIGRRDDASASRYYGGIACEFFKGDFALSQSEIQALGAGLPIKTLAKQSGISLDVYLPMWAADATLLDYSNNGNNASRQSTPTTTEHAPVCTPAKRRRIS